MPRSARIVVSGVPHHITQRGNRRLQTFFSDADYRRYLELIGDECAKAGVSVLAYCLMPNHAHLILVPQDARGLSAALSLAHQKYAWLINRRRGWSGHLWQHRFHSFAMDDPHLYAAVRYVELNPVRAGLVQDAASWQWSSARAHCGGEAGPLLLRALPTPLDSIADWARYLNEGMEQGAIDALRHHVTTGLPLGNEAFVRDVERETGQRATPRPRGRPRRETGDRDTLTA